MPPEVSLEIIQRVAVIGAGQAGRRFALRCARAGFDVALEDVMPANLRHAQEEFADIFISDGDRRDRRGSMSFALTVEDAVRKADIAIDFVPDELESKLEILYLIDRMAPPKTIICTPSEALSITDLASCTYRGDRCIAVKGELGVGVAAQVLHPTSAAQTVLDKVKVFFDVIGVAASVERDLDVPVLMKKTRFI